MKDNCTQNSYIHRYHMRVYLFIFRSKRGQAKMINSIILAVTQKQLKSFDSTARVQIRRVVTSSRS